MAGAAEKKTGFKKPLRKESPMARGGGKSSFKKTIRDESKHEKLGDMLRKEGQITKGQLQDAMEIQKKKGGLIGSILVALGYIDEESIANFLSRHFNFPIIKISDLAINPETLKAIPYDDAKEYLLFPVRVTNNVLTIAMTDPTNNKAIEEMQVKSKMAIKATVAFEKDIVSAYKKYYKISDEEYKSYFNKYSEGDGDDKTSLIEDIDDIGSLVSEATEEMSVEDAEVEMDDQYSAGDAPIIKLVNGILTKAIKQGVSDIHIEPFEKSFQVRYRLDGTLFKTLNLPMQIKNALISRFKILAKLNIAERRVPQDGRIKLKIGKNKAVDFRVSTLPTLFGESIVLRLLDKSNLNVDLTKLGFTEAGFKKFKKAINRAYGLLLVTGPTGSGKTTTLYSAINVLNSVDKKILTVEDPVEFNFSGINQVHVKPDIGMTFANALRAFLRQDPEIIMVGEIRDMETAEIAIKAAMTGHLVFSTLHTNDSPATIGRLIDIGVPPYMVSSAVTMVVSQRLLRKICPKCKEPELNISRERLSEAGFLEIEFKDLQLFRGKGCQHCSGTGYKGRVAVYEIMEVNDIVKRAIASSVSEEQLRKIALKEGMFTLRQEALQRAREGLTTVHEVLRNTVMQKEALPAYLLNPDELTFEDGDLIIKEGNNDNNFYQLIQGRLIISKNGIKVGEISQPGDYFGEMSALMSVSRTATVVSKGRSVIKVFPGDKLQETLKNYPEISLKIVSSLQARLNEAGKSISLLGGREKLILQQSKFKTQNSEEE